MATDPSGWPTLIGHPQLRTWFSSAIRGGRMGGSFLLVGPHGVGKRTVANLLAQTMLCETSDPATLNPCGHCAGCVQVIAETHPDVVRVGKPADKSVIPLELLIGPPESRMQSGFCREVRLRPMAGTRKVAILEDADFLNEEGANCLLKTIEEPPANAIVLLIGTSEQRQLPTIRSRCQIVRLGPLSAADAQRLLRQVHGIDAGEDQIRDAIEISAGDMHVAARLLSGEADQFRSDMVDQLGAAHPDPVRLTKLINARVEQAGKDASERRAAMRDVFALGVQHYRRQMRDEVREDQLAQMTLDRLDRCIRALREVDRNANQTTLIECFSADIAAGISQDLGEIG